MLNRLRTLRQAMDLFCDSPLQCHMIDKKLSPMEWLVLQDFEVIFEVPHAAQQTMSSESTPILSGAVPTFEKMMQRWNELVLIPHLAPFVNIGLDWMDKYDDRMSATNTYAVAMFIDPTMCMSWMEKHWGQQRAKDAKKHIIKLMHGKRGTNTSGSAPSPITEVPRCTLGAHIYGLPDMETLSDCHDSVQTVDQEFEAYSTATYSPKGTDILSFWRASQGMFPTIYAVVMDYLPTQASAVPCKQVFSLSSETYTKKRNYLSPVLMEALQIIKFILKKERLNFTKGWAASQRDMEYVLLCETGSDSDRSFTLNTSGVSGNSSAHDALLSAIAIQECDSIEDAAIIYGTLH